MHSEFLCRTKSNIKRVQYGIWLNKIQALLSLLTLANASSNSLVMNNLRHGSRSGAVKWRLHLMMPQISQSTGLLFGSCFKSRYFCTFWKVCDILDLCCNATIITVQPAANEKLIINPKKILKQKKQFICVNFM